jgi:hypothetical protein
MLDIFVRDPGIFIAFVAIVSGSLIAITAILAHNWRAVRLSETEGALKRDMLNRGMSAEDIERVIKATDRVAADAWSESDPKTETISDNEKELVENLVAEGKTGEEIERILLACKTVSQQARARAAHEAEYRG